MWRWLSSVFRSFGPAVAGLVWALKTQRNLQVHGLGLVAACAAGVWFHILPWEWCMLAMASGLVWTAELLNTAIEALADRVSLAREEAIRVVKDVAAAAVLVSACAALAVGVTIFGPRLWALGQIVPPPP